MKRSLSDTSVSTFNPNPKRFCKHSHNTSINHNITSITKYNETEMLNTNVVTMTNNFTNATSCNSTTMITNSNPSTPPSHTRCRKSKPVANVGHGLKDEFIFFNDKSRENNEANFDRNKQVRTRKVIQSMNVTINIVYIYVLCIDEKNVIA